MTQPYRLGLLLLLAVVIIQPLQAQDFMQSLSQGVCACLDEENFSEADDEQSGRILGDCITLATQQLPEDELSAFLEYAETKSSSTIGVQMLMNVANECPTYKAKLMKTLMTVGQEAQSRQRSGSLTLEEIDQAEDIAEKLYEEGDYYGALQRLNVLLKQVPGNAEAHRVRGMVYLELEDNYRAIADFHAALEYGIAHSQYYYGLGVAKINLGQYADAVPDLRKAMKGYRDGLVYNLLGDAYYWLDNADSTVYFYRAAVERTPQDYDFNYDLVKTLQELGERDKAMDVVDEALVTFENKADAYFLRAELYYEESDYAAALEDYAQVLKHGWEDEAGILTSMGTSAYYLEEYDDAIDYFNQAIKKSTRVDPATYIDRGLIYQEMGKHKLAIKDFSRALTMDPSAAVYYDYRGKSHLELELWREAEEDFSTSLSMYPDDPEIIYLRGRARLGNDDIYGACIDFGRAKEEYEYEEATEDYYEHCTEVDN